MKSKAKKIDTTFLTPLEVYSLVVNGDLKKFPNGYITKESMKEILRQVILEKLHMSREEICHTISYPYLRKYKLGGTRRAFNSSIFSLITYCFPEFDIRYWELNKVEDGFWEKEKNRKEFMIWLAEKEGIYLNSIHDLTKINAKLIQKYGGSKAIKYGGGVYELIKLVAEVDVKEWQVIKMPVWTEEKVRNAVKWLVEERLKWTKEQVVDGISANVFYDNDLGGMLKRYCNHSPLRALQIAYLGEYTKVRNSRPEYLRH